MYAYFTGKLVDKHPTKVILETAGIGYDIFVPLSTFSQLPQLGNQVKLQVHCCIKEDAHDLFGFLTFEEKNLFLKLISISGFGPKGAISVLSSVSVPFFVTAINNLDTDTLTSIPGIGQKTAQRLILELKDKLIVAVDSTGKAVSTATTYANTKIKDAIDALVSLGYSLPKARKSVEKTVHRMEEDATAEEIIREALKKGGS